ncbi:MAG: sulfur carrier protein ThiS [Kiritimatiellaceae bacterium]|nr:sulfur carrier protein ThiS [Kiritimatiellaceae bacterium]
MRINVNGVPSEVKGTFLSDLLIEQGFPVAVATAVNEQFVPIAKRDAWRLEAGDRVEVLAPMQGG